MIFGFQVIAIPLHKPNALLPVIGAVVDFGYGVSLLVGELSLYGGGVKACSFSVLLARLLNPCGVAMPL